MAREKLAMVRCSSAPATCDWVIDGVFVPDKSGIFRAKGGYDMFDPGLLFNTLYLLVAHHLEIRRGGAGAGHEDYEAVVDGKVIGNFIVHAYLNGSVVEYNKI